MSPLQFHGLLSTALREHCRKTGKAFVTNPFTVNLVHCDSSEAVLYILQEQAHAHNHFWNGGWKVQLMRWLRPTVDILLGLSTRALIWYDYQDKSSFGGDHYPSCRDFQQRKRHILWSSSLLSMVNVRNGQELDEGRTECECYGMKHIL
jgi:hypothetical protein